MPHVTGLAGFLVFDSDVIGTCYDAKSLQAVYEALRNVRGLCALNDGVLEPKELQRLAIWATQAEPSDAGRPLLCACGQLKSDAYVASMWTDNPAAFESAHRHLCSSGPAGYLGYLLVDGFAELDGFAGYAKFDAYARRQLHLAQSIALHDGCVINGTGRFGIGVIEADRQLLRAVCESDEAAARAALAAGANPDMIDYRDRRSSVLFWAVECRQTDIVGLLLDRGANPNTDNSANSALTIAACHGDLPILNALLSAGADPTAVVFGDTALSAAESCGQDEAVKLMRATLSPRGVGALAKCRQTALRILARWLGKAPPQRSLRDLEVLVASLQQSAVDAVRPRAAHGWARGTEFSYFGDQEALKRHLLDEIARSGADRILVVGGQELLRELDGATLAGYELHVNVGILEWLGRMCERIRTSHAKHVLVSHFPREWNPPTVTYQVADTGIYKAYLPLGGSLKTVRAPSGTSLALLEPHEPRTRLAVYFVGLYAVSYYQSVLASQRTTSKTFSACKILVGPDDPSVAIVHRRDLAQLEDDASRAAKLIEVSEEVEELCTLDPASRETIAYSGGLLVGLATINRLSPSRSVEERG